MTSASPRPSFRKLDGYTRKYCALEDALDEARSALQEAIVRHLRERNARPGHIADHTPWDRVWVGELGRQAGVPPVKGKNAVGPPPKYDPDTSAAALAELDTLTAAYRAAENGLEKLRLPFHEEIHRLYQEGVPLGELAPHTPYDPEWVGVIGRKGPQAAKTRAGGRASSARRSVRKTAEA
jgi:hypothetical protein